MMCRCTYSNAIVTKSQAVKYVVFICIVWCTWAVENNGGNMQHQDTTQQTPEYKEMVVHIPQYGKVVGRREEGVDVWRGIPYAGM